MSTHNADCANVPAMTEAHNSDSTHAMTDEEHLSWVLQGDRRASYFAGRIMGERNRYKEALKSVATLVRPNTGNGATQTGGYVWKRLPEDIRRWAQNGSSTHPDEGFCLECTNRMQMPVEHHGTGETITDPALD